MTSKIVKLKIDTSNDADIDLLRLMAAVNDISRALRCMIADYQPSQQMPACAYDKETRGYYSYFGRMACGHLSEALAAFKRFHTLPKVKPAVQKFSPEAKKAFDNLVVAVDPSNPESFFEKRLKSLRSGAAFHYKAQDFKEQAQLALSDDAAHQTAPQIIAGQTHGETHYSFADDIISKIFMKHANYSEQGTEVLMREIKFLQFDLIAVVDTYISVEHLIEDE